MLFMGQKMKKSTVNQYIVDKFSHFNLNEEEIFELNKILIFKRFRRKEIIFSYGERVTTIALIIEGAVYSSILQQDGTTRITSLHYPSTLGEIIFNFEDYLQDRPSKKNYRVQDDCLLLMLDIPAVKRLYEQFPRFYQLELMIIQPNFVTALKNIEILQSKNAADKIKLLKFHAPEVFKLFPYGHIASYLGIHRNTFNNVISIL